MVAAACSKKVRLASLPLHPFARSDGDGDAPSSVAVAVGPGSGVGVETSGLDGPTVGATDPVGVVPLPCGPVDGLVLALHPTTANATTIAAIGERRRATRRTVRTRFTQGA